MKKTTLLILSIVLSYQLQAQGLKDLLPAGKYIGTAVNNQYLQGNTNVTGYNDSLISDFNCIVAENAFKMGYIIPNRPADPFNLTLADFSATQLGLVDKMLDTAAKYGMKVRGHAFIWHSQAPSWLTSDAPGWTDQQIYDFVESYITLFATYCKGRVDEWDVVNEALNDNGNGFRTGTWYDKVTSKQDFIEYCFTVAHAADPDAYLFYNDYSIELYKNPGSSIGNVKNGPMLQMVNTMLGNSIPIHGVGLQSHYVSGSGMTDSTYIILQKTVDSLNTLGLFCNMTELDVRICGGTDEAELLKQEDEYKKITEVFLNNDNCNTLLVWGITDKTSWIPGVFSGCDDPLLYNDLMKAKHAYYGIKEILMTALGVFTGPFGFEPNIIPGKIEMENYDFDGFYDNDEGNTGGVYRTDSVDITTGNTGYVVSWTEAGEYLTYTVDVNITDTFELAMVYASNLGVGNNSEIELSIDHVPFDNIILPTTGSVDNYDTISIDSILLSKGIHTIKVRIISGGANIDYMELSMNDCNGVRNGSAYFDDCMICAGGNTGITPCYNRTPFVDMTIPGTIEAENYDAGKNGVTYSDGTTGNDGGVYRVDDVDIGSSASNENEIFVGWVETGEWLEYTASVEETAEYDVTFRVASNSASGKFSVSVNGVIVINNVAVPNTGGWETFSDVVINNVPLTEGKWTVIRITVTGTYFNFDNMKFEISEPTDINENYSNNLLVKPNPFADEVQIEGLRPNQRWILYSLDGKVLMEGTSDRIITNDLRSGVYIFRTDNQYIKLFKK